MCGLLAWDCAGEEGAVARLPACLSGDKVQRPGSYRTRAHPPDVAGCRLRLQAGGRAGLWAAGGLRGRLAGLAAVPGRALARRAPVRVRRGAG